MKHVCGTMVIFGICDHTIGIVIQAPTVLIRQLEHSVLLLGKTPHHGRSRSGGLRLTVKEDIWNSAPRHQGRDTHS